jgi:hypothetical protein
MTNQEDQSHHHKEILKAGLNSQPPETELISLANAKGQTLTADTLRSIKEALELQGVTLEEFVACIRPHFQRGILNPSGFLISRARNFYSLSSPAVPPPQPAPRSVVPTSGRSECKRKGSTAGTSAEIDRDWVRNVLLDYPLARHLAGTPGDAIIDQILEVAGDRETIGWALRTMNAERLTPSRSWGWFPVVIAEFCQKRRR